MNHETLTLVIPVYNGASILPSTFARLDEFFCDKPWIERVVFVDDGSVDNSFELLTRYQHKAAVHVQVMSQSKNRGKGAALENAVAGHAVHTTYIAFTDVDLPYGLEALEDMYWYMNKEEGAHMIVGDRTKSKDHAEQYVWYRYIIAKIFRLFLPKVVRNVPDTQCGIKVFRRDIAKHLFSLLRTHRWVFDIELILAAIEHGYSIHRWAVRIESGKKSGDSTIALRDVWRVFQDMYRIRRYGRQGYYKKT